MVWCGKSVEAADKDEVTNELKVQEEEISEGKQNSDDEQKSVTNCPIGTDIDQGRNTRKQDICKFYAKGIYRHRCSARRRASLQLPLTLKNALIYIGRENVVLDQHVHISIQSSANPYLKKML